MGLNAYHGDAAAALLVDGEVVAAVEEERFTRIKHWSGFPKHSIHCCLEIAELSPSDIDIWAINSDDSAHRLKKLAYIFSHHSSLRLAINRMRNRKQRKNIASDLSENFSLHPDRQKVVKVEHHYCHLASAYYPSGFDHAAVLSIDGMGDFASASWGVGEQSTIRQDGFIHFPHSLGVFYQAITQLLGFKNYGDEYKVMGLSSYGKPNYCDEMDQIITSSDTNEFRLNVDYFRHHNQSIAFSWENDTPKFDDLYSKKMIALLGPERQTDERITERHFDLAASAQRTYEKHFFRILNQLYQSTNVKNLALAGGCAMNSVANGKIKSNTQFEQIYVQPAAGDAGGALGAAYFAWHRYGNVTRNDSKPSAYLGPEYSDECILQILEGMQIKLEQQSCSWMCLENKLLIEKTVSQLIQGKVIGWFQGRMEWGARALGNRSIFGDPRRQDMKDILNKKIKRRESFRPFAPSILRDHVKNWFEIDDDVPHMQKVYQVREEKRHEIPAVTHVDGSGRLQTVEDIHNSLYYQLINQFYSETNVPILLNTSFNENEPIVCHPQQALDCFLRTNMDVLVMGSYFLQREEKKV